MKDKAKRQPEENNKLPRPEDYRTPEERPGDPENCHRFLAEKLETLPSCPGVYLMRDERHRVIYVGKSACLKNRVRSYFHSQNLSERIRRMVAMIRNFDIITVQTEMEALLLENNLIKKYRPYFNVLFRDDKQYPALELTTFETFPRLRIIRPRGGRIRGVFFGPYANGINLKQAVKTVQKLFKLRPCHETWTKPKDRPCLYSQLNMCSAPCTGSVSPQEYAKQVEMAIKFLNGHTKELLNNLHTQIKEEAALLRYERCAQLRDMIKAIELLEEKQQIVFNNEAEADYISLAYNSEHSLCCALLWQIREGKLQGQHSFILETRLYEEEAEHTADFIQRYYAANRQPPREICVEYQPENAELLIKWLENMRRSKVSFIVPKAGAKKQLLRQAKNNAVRCLQDEMHAPSRLEVRRQALKELQEALKLPKLPIRMECYDISNIQGRYAVGSMVVFEHGLPHRSHYRKFKIVGMDTPNDFAMMRQVLLRRLSHLDEVREQPAAREFRLELQSLEPRTAAGLKADLSLETRPDLIIVDGGLGQLGIAVEVLQRFDLTDKIALAGLAKRQEELFRPGQKLSVLLPEGSSAYNAVTHLRNEAHRFAITFHRQLRSKAMTRSGWQELPGVGPKASRLLRSRFFTLERLAEASLEELQEVKGIGPKTAHAVWQALHDREKG